MGEWKNKIHLFLHVCFSRFWRIFRCVIKSVKGFIKTPELIKEKTRPE